MIASLPGIAWAFLLVICFIACVVFVLSGPKEPRP